ncbi:MAG: hypothetical protein ACLPXT_09790 [Terracidiphilus sp.]
MMLSLHGTEPNNVFRLCGNNENSASFALGWTLERSAVYRNLVIREMFGEYFDVSEVEIAMQKHGEDGGYTDIEIKSGREFQAIVEAKRSWGLPSNDQLERYLPRLISGCAKHQLLVSVGAASQTYSKPRLPKKLGGVKIKHLSWGKLHKLASIASTKTSRFEEKLWLHQLTEHLKEFTSMGRQNDNKVYVVALNPKPLVEGKKYTSIDAVEKHQCYFHPVGDGYPKEPPNYIGFRYKGCLQSVHHIDTFEIAKDVSKCNHAWCKTTKDHFVYRLGPPMLPKQEIRTGNLFRAQRVECAIDTLLSGAFDTVRAACDETKRRREGSA